MGLTMRTPAFRVTAWYAWDTDALVPLWETYGQFGIELYDHGSVSLELDSTFDSPAEATNLADDPAYTDTLAQLKTELEAAFGRASP